ncbi:MAG: hypothetical protein U9R58_05365 [Chloroflexota bacterium]|nr:hypothetical protein [Chloroflexota bacterium]
MIIVKLEDAYLWLNQFDCSRLSVADNHRIKILNDCIGSGDCKNAWHMINRLTSGYESVKDECSAAEILVVCGRAAYKLGDCVEAADFFEKARTRYGWRKHQAAVVSWMLGYAYWGLLDRNDQTFPVWEKSMSEFDRLASSYPPLSDRNNWYKRCWWMMKDTMNCYQDQDCLGKWEPVR